MAQDSAVFFPKILYNADHTLSAAEKTPLTLQLAHQRRLSAFAALVHRRRSGLGMGRDARRLCPQCLSPSHPTRPQPWGEGRPGWGRARPSAERCPTRRGPGGPLRKDAVPGSRRTAARPNRVAFLKTCTLATRQPQSRRQVETSGFEKGVVWLLGSPCRGSAAGRSFFGGGGVQLPGLRAHSAGRFG